MPYIKLHQLPAGYSQDSDTDIQQTQNDELVPVTPKLAQLSAVNTSTPLVGVLTIANQPLYRFDHSGGQTTTALVLGGSIPNTYLPTGVDWNAHVLWEPQSNLTPVIHNSSSVLISPSTYTLSANGVTFIGPAPTGPTITYWPKSTTSTTYALHGNTQYTGSGTNPAWNTFVMTVAGVITAIDSGVLATAFTNGYLTCTTGSPLVTYAVVRTVAKTFLSPNPNWVGGHINMWPDVFVGTYNYPGDNYTDTSGTPVVPGLMPLFVEPGNYQINFRDGSVTFPALVDGTATPVRVNYAYVTGIGNATGQVLAPDSTRKIFQVSDTTALSYGKKWINRQDQYLPRTIYINGVPTPQVTTIVPYDTLTVKHP